MTEGSSRCGRVDLPNANRAQRTKDLTMLTGVVCTSDCEGESKEMVVETLLCRSCQTRKDLRSKSPKLAKSGDVSGRPANPAERVDPYVVNLVRHHHYGD